MNLSTIGITYNYNSNLDFISGKYKLYTTSHFFLKNCICNWELDDGILYIKEVFCYYGKEEIQINDITSLEKLLLEKVYVQGIIEDDNRVSIKKLSIKDIVIEVPCNLFPNTRYYSNSKIVKLVFEYGDLIKIETIKYT